jgi:hypothetical protein
MLLHKFKQIYSFEERQACASNILKSEPEMIPTVVEKLPTSSVQDLPNPKFLLTDKFDMQDLA